MSSVTYDYELQVWVKDGIIQDCGHPKDMKDKGCCNAHAYAGFTVEEIKEDQRKED